MDYKGRSLIGICLVFLILSCSPNQMSMTLDNSIPIETNVTDKTPRSEKYKTKNVIILVIDGPRFSETWGDPLHSNIPVLSNTLSKKGVVNTNFFNLGQTYTTAGHTAITTGNYQKINNGGQELPELPSIFQLWSEKYGKENSSSFIIASKDKLAVLANTEHKEWQGRLNPSTDCGNAGLFSGYRTDEETYDKTFNILTDKHPELVLINLKGPDSYGHANDWPNYLNSITESDAFLGTLWDFIQNDPYYADNTTLFMTNDHGRHGDSIKNGFISHGDSCTSCRHINFFAIGPDFGKNKVLGIPRSQIDIASTIGELLQFEMPYSQGEVMYELFEQDAGLDLAELKLE